MDKNEAIKIIVDCANEYHSNLENHNILFVFGKQPKIEVMETVFLSTNFLHLTGIKESPSLHNKTRFFYKKCLENKLSPDDFEFSSDGTTELKLKVLPKIMKIHKTAKMIGDYNNCKLRLVTDKLAGNIESCLGFIMCNQFYMPNTVLKEDIRNLVLSTNQVLATYKKSIKDEQYSNCCYIAKSINPDELVLPNNFNRKIK